MNLASIITFLILLLSPHFMILMPQPIYSLSSITPVHESILIPYHWPSFSHYQWTNP